MKKMMTLILLLGSISSYAVAVFECKSADSSKTVDIALNESKLNANRSKPVKESSLLYKKNKLLTTSALKGYTTDLDVDFYLIGLAESVPSDFV
jgi:hypothetical protein